MKEEPQFIYPEGKEKKGMSRREFLRVGAVGAAALGGASLGANIQREDSATEGETDPAQEMLNTNQDTYAQGVQRGDMETITSATEIINEYAEEQKRLTAKYDRLLNKLSTANTLGSERALLEMELFHIRQRQDWVKEQITLLRGPIDYQMKLEELHRKGPDKSIRSPKGTNPLKTEM